MLKLNIRSKQFLLVIVILIPLIILQGIRINEAFKDKVKSELKASEDLAEAIATSFTNYLEEVWVQQDIVGSYILMQPDARTDEIQTYLKDVHTKQETILDMSWVDTSGKVISSSTTELVGKSLYRREYIQRILRGEERVISDLTFSVLDSTPIIVMATGIKKDGKLQGIITSVIDVKEINHRMPNSKVTTTSRFGLIDRNGMMVYRSDLSEIPPSKRRINNDSPAWRALNGEVVRTFNKVSDEDNSNRMGVDYPIKKIGWDCFVTTSYESVMMQHNRRLKQDIIILSIVSCVSIVLAYLFGRKLLRPLSQLKDAAVSMKTGDFSARTNILGFDELAVTAEAFDSMAESIERYDRAKSQFFTNLSHELKTPLNVILASTQLLEKIDGCHTSCPNYNQIHKQTKIVKQNSYRLIRMINNLIDVSRYESEHTPIKLGNYNIVSTVEDITLSVVRFAETKEIQVLFDTDVEEKIIAFDRDMIERILLNLLSNSLKFTNRKGSVMVSVFDNDQHVVISVKDTGIGIPQEKIKSIFERFEQVDSSLSRNKEGSGIGLSLVKALIEAHNGTIEVISDLGDGTEFVIELPAIVVSEENTTINKLASSQSHNLIERIAIEFSDIYDMRDRH